MANFQRGLTFAGSWVRGFTRLTPTSGLLWGAARVNRHSLETVLRYAALITVPAFRPTSVFGFSLLLAMVSQFYSGFLLSLYYLPDPSFTISIREDLMMEVWWFLYVYKAHVIGVDLIFTLSYLHILKKLYLRNYAEGDLDGWFTGGYAFLIFHLVVFLGITLSTNHLGDVTVSIGANIYWSLLLRWHKTYTPFFTNKHLNTDQLTRFMITHYLSAWYYAYLVQNHVFFIHEMWDADSNRSAQQSSSSPRGAWLWDSLNKEGLTMLSLLMLLAIVYFLMMHPDFRVVNFTFFEQWSESEMEDINFFAVAPHWYFRAHMGLLTVCAQHYEGLAWMGAFYFLICYTPHVYRFWNRPVTAVTQRPDSAPIRQSPAQEALFVLFALSLLYVGGTLPCGRFYYDGVEGFFGNAVLRLSYEYIYLYLGLLAHIADRLERSLGLAPQSRPALARVAGLAAAVTQTRDETVVSDTPTTARLEALETHGDAVAELLTLSQLEGLSASGHADTIVDSVDQLSPELTPSSAAEAHLEPRPCSLLLEDQEGAPAALTTTGSRFSPLLAYFDSLVAKAVVLWSYVEAGVIAVRHWLNQTYPEESAILSHLTSAAAWAETLRFVTTDPRAFLWGDHPTGVRTHLVGLLWLVAACGLFFGLVCCRPQFALSAATYFA